MGFELSDDYVDVAARLSQFYEKYPDGRVTRLDTPHVMVVGDKPHIVYGALAYRTPDDPTPCVGTAWEPYPGTTPYTKGSELMNAETAAWGRAIVAAGIPSKKVASSDEIAARSGGDADPLPEWAQEATMERKVIALGSVAYLFDPDAFEDDDADRMRAANERARDVLKGVAGDLGAPIPEAVALTLSRVARALKDARTPPEQPATTGAES